MLHLDAAVDLNEVRLPVGANEELQRPHVLVARGADRLRRARKELLTHARSERRRWRLFHELLVAPLQRTVALAKVERRPFMIDGNLHLNMVRSAQILLEIDGSVAERRLRLLYAE